MFTGFFFNWKLIYQFLFLTYFEMKSDNQICIENNFKFSYPDAKILSIFAFVP